MRHDWQGVVTQRLLDVERSRAIEAVATQPHEVESGAQVVLCRQQITERSIGQAHLHETASRGVAHFRREKAAFNRQHVDARRAGCRSFFQPRYIKHGNLLSARLHGADVGNCWTTKISIHSR